LKAHAEGLAVAIKLNLEQTDLLVSEIRNALSPVVATAFTLDGLPGLDAEELSDFKASIARVLALMSAFDRSVR
jgi:hypothetical protein